MLIKQPYELSIWTEQLEDGIKVEKKGAIIGAHDMTYLGKATNICLKKEIKGTATLSFDMPSKYFDSKLGDYVHNDFVDAILAETKVKLHYKNKWYEFTIKKIVENKKFKAIMYTYTCQDSFIDELSKTGYNITFAPELNNSVEEIGQFMVEILDMSVWDYVPKYNIGDFVEYNEQMFYKIPTSQFGGTIYGYMINLEVNRSMMLDKEGNPKKTFQNYLKKKGIDWNSVKKEGKENSCIDTLLTIYNVLTDEERQVEFGDDLARELELFWDPHKDDAGSDLLSEENRYELTTDYIYIPSTDLIFIMGSLYENSTKAVQDIAFYGTYGNNLNTYALQPYSKNPRDLIQFICIPNGGEIHVDEANVLNNNDYHYVIPIEELNQLLKAALPESGPLIYWKAEVDLNTDYKSDASYVSMTKKYSVAIDNDIIYTTDARPESSVIDDFTWYPLYSEGYLTELDGLEISKARKISVTNRTVYNKDYDGFVTVYQNSADNYTEDNLYSEKELQDRIVKYQEDYRVCSKLNTRQILPELARNLVQNGTEITDTNGWEAKTQNYNELDKLGTGSYYHGLSTSVESRIAPLNKDELTSTIDTAPLSGTPADEIISNYYLRVVSPYLSDNTIDFSLENEKEKDYVLNFGMVSQEKKIEKDKIYALRLKTGDVKITEIKINFRNNKDEESYKLPEDNIGDIIEIYKNSYDIYYKLITAFYYDSKDKIEEKLMSLFEKNIKKYIEEYKNNKEKLKEEQIINFIKSFINIFWDMKENLYNAKFDIFTKQKKQVDKNILAILFGGEYVNMNLQDKDTLNYGLISLYDEVADVSEEYQKIKNFSKGKYDDDISLTDGIYLKYCIYISNNHLTEKERTRYSPLTKKIIEQWKEENLEKGTVLTEEVNKFLDKIIIGAGSVNSEGNYLVEGIDSGNSYIKFTDLFEGTGLQFVPDCDSSSVEIENKELLTTTQYHYKNKNNWIFTSEEPNSESVVYIKDAPFLLFKANQTINSPYIGLQVESAPAEFTFDDITEKVYKSTTDTGAIINIKKDDIFGKDIQISLYLISNTNFTDEFLKAIDYNKEKGTFNTGLKSFTWKDEYFKSQYKIPDWKGTTKEVPSICSSFIYNNDSSDTSDTATSIPFIMFIEDECAGIVYITR